MALDLTARTDLLQHAGQIENSKKQGQRPDNAYSFAIFQTVRPQMQSLELRIGRRQQKRERYALKGKQAVQCRSGDDYSAKG